MKALFIFAVSTIAIVSSEFHCTPGSAYKMDCNSCICSNDGKTAMCTGIACPQEIKKGVTDAVEKVENVEPAQTQGVGEEFRCIPGSNFYQDCNSCICLIDGKSAMCTGIACTKKFKRDLKMGMCDSEILNKDVPMHISPKSLQRSARSIGSDHKCKPGHFFKNDCNHCICDNDGVTVQCTVLDCSKLDLSQFNNNPLLIKGHHPRNRRAGLF